MLSSVFALTGLPGKTSRPAQTEYSFHAFTAPFSLVITMLLSSSRGLSVVAISPVPSRRRPPNDIHLRSAIESKTSLLGRDESENAKLGRKPLSQVGVLHQGVFAIGDSLAGAEKLRGCRNQRWDRRWGRRRDTAGQKGVEAPVSAADRDMIRHGGETELAG